MHAMWITHFIFGGFLVWTGFKTATADEDDEDPSQHPAVKWLQRQVPDAAGLCAHEGRGSSAGGWRRTSRVRPDDESVTPRKQGQQPPAMGRLP